MPYLTPGAVILVTGATGGIGFEIASQAAAGGAVVAVHGSRPQTVAAAIERLGGPAPAGKGGDAPGGFRETGEIAPMGEKVADEAGRLDAVIHCAITGAPGTTGFFRKTEPEN